MSEYIRPDKTVTRPGMDPHIWRATRISSAVESILCVDETRPRPACHVDDHGATDAVPRGRIQWPECTYTEGRQPA